MLRDGLFGLSTVVHEVMHRKHLQCVMRLKLLAGGQIVTAEDEEKE